MVAWYIALAYKALYTQLVLQSHIFYTIPIYGIYSMVRHVSEHVSEHVCSMLSGIEHTQDSRHRSSCMRSEAAMRPAFDSNQNIMVSWYIPLAYKALYTRLLIPCHIFYTLPMQSIYSMIHHVTEHVCSMQSGVEHTQDSRHRSSCMRS